MQSPEERTVLSKDLSDFLVELSVGLHKHNIYPEGHPFLDPAARSVQERLERLLGERATLSLGVARRQLVIEGVATDSENELLRDLAGRLHRHQLGAVRFHKGVTANEVVDFLKTLSVEVDRSDEALAAGRGELPSWSHIRLFPLTYDQLELVGDGSEELAEDRGKATRTQQLWIGLARAAMAADEEEEEDPSTDADDMARAINDHPRADAYDQVIVGYLLQISDELGKGEEGGVNVRGRMSRLIDGLDPETLQHLLHMGGDRSQRQDFVRNAAHGLEADAVVRIAEAAASASKQNISTSLSRLLSKLAVHAEHGPVRVPLQADAALREQVEELVSGWSLEDPNPDSYTLALERMSVALPGDAEEGGEYHLTEARRLVEMALEVDVVGPQVWRGVEELMEEEDGRRGLFEILRQAPGEPAAAEAIWDRVATPEWVAWILEDEDPDFDALDRILPRVGSEAVDAMLDVLMETQDRAVRRGILDRLPALGPEVGTRTVERLERDDRWFVKRNMLWILNELEFLPPAFSPRPFLQSEDPRVRREALKVALSMPEERDRALLAGLRDPDLRTVRTALAAAQGDLPKAGLPLVLGRIRSENTPSDLRVMAVRALKGAHSPLALDALLGLVSAGKSLLGKPKLKAKSPELLEALRVLADSWARDARTEPLLERARGSKDGEIRAAAGGA